MSDHIAIVTDSTSCLPDWLSKQWGIKVVQMQLRVDDRVDDEQRFDRREIVSALPVGKAVHTIPPAVGAFFWAYQEAVAAGATAIVSVHISGRLSTTVQAAREAAAQINLPVYVVDSGTTGMSLGFAVLSAARAVAAGAEIRRVIYTAERRFCTSTELIYVDTLDYLRQSGRVSGFSASLGNTLSVKPLLTVRAGEITPLTRVTGSKRALDKLIELAIEYAGERDVDMAITKFSTDQNHLDEAIQTVQARVPRLHEALIVDASLAIGAHVGPGALGITISPT